MKHNNELKLSRKELILTSRISWISFSQYKYSLKKYLQQHGVTLIELLIVISVVAILSVSGIHSWQNYQQELKLEVSSQQMLAFLTHLQSEANQYNREISLWVRRYPNWCIGRKGLAEECNTRVTGIFTPPYADILLSDFNNIKFYGLRNTAMPGHLTLVNSSGRIRVALSGRGRLRLCSENQRLMSIPRCQ